MDDQSTPGCLPLPVKVITKDELRALGCPNLSLKYFKLANIFKDNWKDLTYKSGFLKELVELSKKSEYAEAFKTRRGLLDRIGDGFSLTTGTRLTFGLGYEHPTEIGFTFDWTTGLPIIPGSSLKGVALSYAKDNTEKWDAGEREEIFGSKDEVGRIVFLPAYPCIENGEQFLEVDVMTPHYGPYYESKGGKPPADWYNPNPLYFLTVPKGVKYCFRLADRWNIGRKVVPEDNSDILNKACAILRAALMDHGVGAKTAVDYGRFE